MVSCAQCGLINDSQRGDAESSVMGALVGCYNVVLDAVA